MNCKPEYVNLMHKYLDGDLNKQEELILRGHLESCATCQAHFHELSRTITLIQSTPKIAAPEGFSENIMMNLPTEKRHVKYIKWFKNHPIIVTAAMLFLFMFSGAFSMWNKDTELVVSKQENLMIQGETVIVPEGVTVVGDLYVKNGDLRIDGQVDGDVTLINGKLLVDKENIAASNELVATVDGVNGELTHVNQLFEWIWYNIQQLFGNVFSFHIMF